jgi:hypothetical protein
MKYTVFFILLLCLTVSKLHSQSVTQIDVFGNVNCAVSADQIIVSENGTVYTCIGNVTMTPLDMTDPERRKNDCGGSAGYVCGVLSMQSTSGDVTVFTCVGTSGRCLQVNTQ